MAMILRSDKVATNPSIDWKYVTPYGPTHKEVAEYLAAITTDTFDPGQPIFAALDKFVTDLKVAGIWDKLPEIIPMYGSTYAAVRRKLKGEWGGVSMNGVNGDVIGNYEQAGGVYIGRNKITFATQNGPALDTGFTAARLDSGWGFTTLIDSALPGDATAGSRALMGAALGTAAANRQVEARLAYTSGLATVALNAGNFGSINTTPAAQANFAGLARISAMKTGATTSVFTYLKEGESAVSASGNYDETVPRNRDVWLLGRSPWDGLASTTGFNGKMRFAAFDDGTLGESEAAVLFDAINDLAAAMGKAF